MATIHRKPTVCFTETGDYDLTESVVNLATESAAQDAPEASDARNIRINQVVCEAY
jgi:hypothetical protein